MATSMLHLYCFALAIIVIQSVFGAFPAPIPLDWFEGKNPNTLWQDTRAFEFAVTVRDTEYKTHVKVVEDMPGNANERNYVRRYSISLGRYTTAPPPPKEPETKTSEIAVTYYSDHASVPDSLKSKKLADVVWVGANIGSAIDIWSVDPITHDHVTPAHGRGTVLVTAINAILTELGIDAGTCHNVAGFTCPDGTSKYLEVFHRMWQGKGAWYTSFGYNPPAEQEGMLREAKQNILTKRLSELYSVADWTAPWSDFRVWRRAFKARIEADLGKKWLDEDLTLKDLMVGYVNKMKAQPTNNAHCSGYVKMMKILNDDSNLHPDLQLVRTSNENLRHAPYT